MEHARVEQFLDLVYETAVQPDQWGAVLGSLGRMIGAPSASMIRQDEATGAGDAVRWNIDPLARTVYYSYFGTRNVLHNTPDPAATIRRWKPAVLTDEDKLPKDSLLRSEYYNDFMRRFDVHSVMMIRIAVAGMDTVTINLNRPRRLEAYNAEELSLARRLQPHLIRAYQLSQKLAGQRRVGEQLADWIERSPHGFVLLDETGAIQHMNNAARSFLAEPEGLRTEAGCLTACRPAIAAELAQLIARAAAADAGVRSAGSLAVSTGRRHLPLSVNVVPLTPGANRGVVVCISDLETGANLREQNLRRVFGLTAAESRLALALFDGATPREAADAFGVSRHTVHSQLASIFLKTGAARQSDLIRLMTRAAAPEAS